MEPIPLLSFENLTSNKRRLVPFKKNWFNKKKVWFPQKRFCCILNAIARSRAVGTRSALRGVCVGASCERLGWWGGVRYARHGMCVASGAPATKLWSAGRWVVGGERSSPLLE